MELNVDVTGTIEQYTASYMSLQSTMTTVDLDDFVTLMITQQAALLQQIYTVDMEMH